MEPTLIEIGKKDFIRINKNDTLYNLIRELFRRGEDRAIVYHDDKPVGIVTLTDIALKIATTKSKRVPTTALHVSAVMSSPLIALSQNTSVIKAARVMIEKGISSVPALDEKGDVSALVTKWEIVELLREEDSLVVNAPTSVVREVKETDSVLMVRRMIMDEGIQQVLVRNLEGKPAGIVTSYEIAKLLAELIDYASEYGPKDYLKEVKVGEIMRPYVPTKPLNSKISDIAELVTEKKVKAVYLVEEGEIKASTTLNDLVRYFVSKAVF